MASTSAAGLLARFELRDSLSAWEIAKARFLDGLDEDEKAIFNEATVENLFYNASNMERVDRKESKTRSVLQNIQPLISAVEDYGKAMDAFANIASLYLAPIWGSVRVVLVIASSHGRFYARMVDTFGRIGDMLPRFRDYQSIFDGQKHRRFNQALSAAYLDIILLCTEFKTLLRNQRKSSMKRIFQPLSPSLNTHLEDAVIRFRQHRKAVDKEAELCHMIEAKEARELVLRNSAAAEARERQMRQKNLLSLLSKTDNEYKHRRMQRIRHPGTGAWFKSSPEFKDWLICKTSTVMCCYGIPGCGKSVLTSSLIDGMLSELGPESKNTITFYYCDHADKRTLDPVNIFSSLALQVLRALGDLTTGLSALLESICQDGKVPELEDVANLFLEAIKRTPSTVLFVDGTDEVLDHDRKLIFLNLREIIIRAPSSVVKVFIASREDTTYLTQVLNMPIFKMRMGVDTIAGDIESYVRHSIRDLVHRHELIIGDPSLEDEIFTALSEGAKGMFLWVKFQLDDLCLAETDNAIKKVLQNLPRDLSETYDRLLARIDSAERRVFVRRMFNWIICARRPLRVSELREAIAFTIDDYQFDTTKVPNDLNRLIRSCGNLIMIDDDMQNVQLAHYSVQQYLLDQHRPQPSLFHITKEEANFEVGKVCVAYLTFSDVDMQMTKYRDNVTPNFAVLENIIRTQTFLPPNSHALNLVKALKKFRRNQNAPTNIEFARHFNAYKRKLPPLPLRIKYSLLPYVAENWLYHTISFTEETGGKSRATSKEIVARHLRLFDDLAFEREFAFDIRPWDGVPLPSDELPYVIQIGWAISANHLPLLHAIALRGERGHLVHYLDHATDFCFEGFEGQPVKHLPDAFLKCFNEHPFETFPCLDDWRDWMYHRILSASGQGCIEALEFCFYNWDGPSWTPSKARLYGHLLLEAALHSRRRIVEVLSLIILTWKPEFRNVVWLTRDYDGLICNALELAAISGSEDVMELLSTAGCRVSATFQRNILRNSKLREVIEAGDVSKVRSLLKIFGATDRSLANIESGLYNKPDRSIKDANALSHCVQSLVRASIIKTVSDFHWIWMVEALGFQDKIDVLLAAGGRPFPMDGDWLLWDAIKEDRRERIDLLIKSGVAITTTSEYHISYKKSDIKRKLHPLGIDSLETISPLSWAIINDHHEIVEKLLSAGASVSEVGNNLKYTPLHFAALVDSLESFELLRKYGVKLDILDDHGRTMMEFITKFCTLRHPKRSLNSYLTETTMTTSIFNWRVGSEDSSLRRDKLSGESRNWGKKP